VPPGFPKVSASYSTDPLVTQNNDNNNATTNTNELNMPSIDALPVINIKHSYANVKQLLQR